jgi:aryl-alcohol dehydrogenase-like predicted oxidoreductase
MNRRQFVQTVAASLVIAPDLAAGIPSPAPMPVRTLGRTGIKVPIIGFGSGSRFLMYQDEAKAIEALQRAIDLGITYLDTAHAYGDGKSEERIGRVIATRRQQVVLSTKIPARTAEQARRQIELSLKRLQTDHLDVLHIHDLKGEKDVAAIEARGGVLEALYEARDKKIARAIGITSHANPAGLRDLLERHDFDCTQMALNAGLARMADLPGGMKATPAGAESFERLALPVAIRKQMGVIAMKVFGQEQLIRAASVEKLLAYALSLPVSLASLGMPRLEHIERNAALARAFTPLTEPQRREISESIARTYKTSMLNFFQNHQDA